MAKKRFVLLPAGTANYPHISSADTTGKYADGKYKTKVTISKKDAEPVMQELKNLADALGVNQLPFKEDDEGNVVFSAKSKYKPTIFASDGKTEVTNMNERIGGGSRIRLYAEVWPYDKGISLQMKQVQVIDLVSGNSSAFDAMEGSFDPDDFEMGPSEQSSTSAFNAPDI